MAARPIALVALLLLGAAPQETIKVLFLGDRGHHRPEERFRQLQPVLAARGISMTWTERADDLEPKILAAYDALVLYANIDAISPEQEKALLEFVEGGKGFVPLHCASYCFRNSDKVVALVGAQFKSHGTGVFRAKIVRPDHPAMKDVPEFESWDETYVHARHNEDRTLLAVRENEPWTWVRTHGKGRVFYTAWGHDERTWSNPGFQKQVEQGIRWAAGRAPVSAAARQPALSEGRQARVEGDLKPFEYQEANVPFYAGSHKLGEPWRKMQKPVDPVESAKHVQVPEGFESRLFAAEPEITKPIALAWDSRGRLWISESVDYPNEMQPEGQGRDRIKICEDTDGDGRADKYTVFADKLSIPTSLCPVEGGVIVSQAPHTLLLRDTNGDDKADERKVLFSGWGTGDTHAGPSNLRWGFDNWIWGIVGYSGFNGRVGGREHRFSMGFFRFRPDGSELEFIRSTNNNSWGLGLSEEGIVFGSTANGNPSEYMPVANRYYERVGGWSASRLNGISDNDPFHPVTDKVRQVDHHGRFTAAAGHALYTARLFPKEYWNRAAFVCEPTGHLCAVFRIRAEGANFRSNTTHNLFASDDEWTAPIAAEVGPDGAVWILDWYNYIVQHNPTPAGFKNGRGNAYEIGLRDKTHGRVYRVFPRSASFPKPPSLATTADLVAALKNDNLFWRLHAQRMLVERKALDAKTGLEGLTAEPAAIHALRALEGLGALDAAVAIAALKHPSAGVRRNALEVLPRAEGSVTAVLPLLEDPDAQVRLAAALALSEMPSSREAGRAVFAALRSASNADDKWLPDALTAAAARHDAGFLAATLAGLKAEGVASAQPSKNLIPSGAFETTTGWRKSTYSGRAELSIDDDGRSGKCAKIVSTAGADASWSFTVKVNPGARYRLTAWVRTRGLAKGTGMGALMNLHELQRDNITALVTGTSDWKKLETEFDAGGHAQLTVNCLFGGWGQSKGEAWWDDVSLVELSGRSLSGKTGSVITTVTRNYARRGPVESVLDLLASLKAADPALAGFLLEGLAEGWPKGKAPEIPDARKDELRAVYASLALDSKERLTALAARWERRDLFDTATLSAALTSAVADASKPADERIDAARRLLRLDDRAESVRKVLAPVTALAPPALGGGLVDVLAESRLAETAAILLEHWSNLTPAVRARALAVLLRQPAWSDALLTAVEKQSLQRSDLAAEHWQQLRNHPDKPIADRAAKLAGAGGGGVSPDREAVYAKFLAAAERPGNAARGKELFAQLCSKCHAIDGAGGRVGPDLTGIGVRPRKDLLIEVVDPNRSVEANFRTWQVKTKDGQVLSGRMDAETQTSVELLDVEGKSHVLQRDAIEALKPSALSIMPVGLIDTAPEADVSALFEYLASSKEPPRKK